MPSQAAVPVPVPAAPNPPAAATPLSPPSPPSSPLAWPAWQGEALPAGQAVQVDTGLRLADTLAALGAVATAARRGHRVMLSPPRAHAALLARASGVWALWPQEDVEADRARHAAPPHALQAPQAPHALHAAVGAISPLAALAAALVPEAERPDHPATRLVPRLHLTLAQLAAARDAAVQHGWAPSREGLLGWWLRDLPPPTRLRANGLRHAIWGASATTEAGELASGALPARGPDSDRAGTDAHFNPHVDAPSHATPDDLWLRRAADIAQVDHLLTDDPDAALLALALGRPVAWLGPAEIGAALDVRAYADPLRPVDPQAFQQTFMGQLPARLGALRELPLDDPAAALHALVAASSHCSAALLHEACVRLLVVHPQRPDAWRLLGTLSERLQQPALALGCHARVTEIAPVYGDGWRGYGWLLADQGAPLAAADALDRSLTLNPQDDPVRHRLATLRAQAGRAGEAAALMRPLVAHQPSNWAAQLDLGRWLLADDQPEAAARHLHAALSGTPASAERSLRALPALAEALLRQGDLEGSGACLRQWLQAAPDDPEATLALARNDRLSRQPERALQRLAPLATAAPPDPRHILEWLCARRQALDWTPLTEPLMQSDAALRRWVEAQAPGAASPPQPGALSGPAPASALAFDTVWMLAESATDADLAGAVLTSWRAATHTLPAVPPARPTTAKATAHARTRVRVRYAGSREAVHRHARLLAALLEHHDRRRFEVDVCCWTRLPSDALREPGDGDATVDALGDIETLHDASDRGIAERLSADAIDILVDLDGCGPQARPGIWCHRPARRQLGWLDMLIDQPLPGHDAVLSDTTPADAAPANALLHLGGGLLAIQPRPAQGLAASDPQRRAWRRKLGLPEQAPVIAALAPHEQIDPQRWSAWMDSLLACPPAHLWLELCHPLHRRRLQAAAQAAGVRPDRLHFIHSRALPDGALATIDLYLCTRLEGHGRHDTLLEALAAAVPALCTAGCGPATRLAATLLRQAGQAHGVSLDDAALSAQAIALLRSPRELLQRRAELIEAHRTAPLFDLACLAASLEAAFGQCLERQP